MAFLGLQVPAPTSRLFSEIEVDGDKTALGTYHVTMIYMGKDVPMEVLSEAIKATFEVTSKTRPFSVKTNKVTTFPKNDDGVPIIARVESEALHDLRAKLVESFQANGVDFNNKYPDYKPHVTLSYAEDSISDFEIPTVEWGAHELVLWGGDDGDRKLVVTFPFSLDADKTANKVLGRYLGKSAASSGAIP